MKAKVGLLIVISAFLLLGCMNTRDAIRKIPRPERILEYEAVYLTEGNDIVFQYKVNLNYYDEESKNIADWCATIPLEEIKNIAVDCEMKHGRAISLKNGLPINWESRDMKNYSDEGKHFLSSSEFSIAKHRCSENIIIKSTEIPINPIRKVGVPDRALRSFNSTDQPIEFISGRVYSYLAFKQNIENRLKIGKIENPLLPKQYDEKKTKNLPLSVVRDILTFPFQLIYGIACIATDCHF